MHLMSELLGVLRWGGGAVKKRTFMRAHVPCMRANHASA